MKYGKLVNFGENKFAALPRFSYISFMNELEQKIQKKLEETFPECTVRYTSSRYLAMNRGSIKIGDEIVPILRKRVHKKLYTTYYWRLDD